MPPRKPKPQADQIRELLDAGYNRHIVRTRLGCSRQAVDSADAARGPRGRPSKGTVRVTVYVQPHTAEQLEELAQVGNCTPGEVVDLAIVLAMKAK